MFGYSELFLVLTLASGYLLLSGQPTWRKIIMFAVMLALTSEMLLTSLGSPKPVALQYPRVHGTMLAYSLDEGHAIYVWVCPDERATPMSFQLAWSQHTAAKIEQAVQRGAQEHRAVKVSIGHGFGMPGSPTGKEGNGIPTGGDSLAGPDQAITATLAPVAPVQSKD
jgi:hypothetical protein